MSSVKGSAAARPFFSVVIPCFNRIGTLVAALQSVREQRFADFECVVVDDGSDDGAAMQAVVANLNDSRFFLLRRKNGGAGAARNTGIGVAKGRYIAFLDSDDQFLPGKLEQDFAFLKDTRGSGMVVFSQVLVDRGVGKYWAKPARAPRPKENIDEYLMCDRGFIATPTLVVPGQLARDVRFDEALPYGQDTDFCIRLAAHGARFTMLSRPQVICCDQAVKNRISATTDYQAMLAWTDRIQPLVSRRSYVAYRGWHIARMTSRQNPRLAVQLYFQALLSGAFSPKMAVICALQVILPRPAYRWLANMPVRMLGITKA